MDVLAPIDVERSLVGLVSDAVLDSRPEHHLVAAHEVLHHVLELWLEGLRVDEVEVYLVVSSDLDSLVALDEVDEASYVQLLVLLPGLDVGVVLVSEDLEEEHSAGAPCDQSLVVDEVHLAQIHVCHSLELVVLSIVSVDRERLALAVERVDDVVFVVVEALVWKILLRALHLH